MDARVDSLSRHNAIGMLPISAGFLLAQGTPRRTMLHNPIQKRLFKADVVADLFAFNPFMAKDFFPFSQKFLIKG